MKEMICFKQTTRLMAITLLGSLSACGGGKSGDATATAPVAISPVVQIKPGTWVVMGSSTAAGVGAPAGKGWVTQLAATYAAHGFQIANIAKGGSLTYEALSTGTALVAGRPAPDPAVNIDQALARKPVLLILAYPTNDTMAGYNADETVNNLLAVRKQALAAGAAVLITSSQPRNLSDEKLQQLSAIDQRLAASVGACFVAVRAVLAGADERLASAYDSGDGAHPNEAGHRLIAEQVDEAIATRKCVSLAN